ncbi:MAG: hypothetical protein Q9M08_06370, partial [Mariprofundus sp.]|nr:hypothetical protein [Mariprofundus sp.]
MPISHQHSYNPEKNIIFLQNSENSLYFINEFHLKGEIMRFFTMICIAMGLAMAGCNSEKAEAPVQPAATEASAPETTTGATDAAVDAATGTTDAAVDAATGTTDAAVDAA